MFDDHEEVLEKQNSDLVFTLVLLKIKKSLGLVDSYLSSASLFMTSIIKKTDILPTLIKFFKKLEEQDPEMSNIYFKGFVWEKFR